MTEETRFRETADAVLANAAHPAELVWRRRTGGLTRFANNGVHQHGEVAERQCIVRALKDGRVGVVAEADCTVAGLTGAAERAAAAAAYGPAAPGGFAANGPAPAPLHNMIPATRDTTPAARVAVVQPFTDAAAAQGWTAAGAFSTETVGVGVANSNGVRAWHEHTDSTFSVTVMRPEGGSAWIERSGVDADALGLEEAHATVFAKAERAGDVMRLEPGRYTVVLEPAAVGELLTFLGYLGFGGRQFIDGTGFMSSKLGQHITGDAVTVRDAATHPGMPGLPFDYEGTACRPVTLIDAGVAAGVVHDMTTAAEAGTTTTGHALSQPNSFGPLPLHVVMEPGTASRDELLRQAGDGVLVTRLWYNRVVDPGRTLLTGLTRDGTFRIAGGELGPRVHDFRFNESILEAFRRIVARGDVAERAERSFVPALVIEDFTFSSLSGGP